MNSERGSIKTVAIILFVLIITGAIGYLLWQSSRTKDAQPDNTVVIAEKKLPQQTTPEVKKNTPVIPDGWKAYESDDKSMSFAIPASEKIEYQAYNISEALHVGYGAPVWVKYSQTDGWQTYENDMNNQPTVKRSQNTVKSIDAKAVDKYLAAYYNTGDGPTGESRVLVVVDQKVYQFVFPGKIQTPEFLTQFVKTLTFK